MKKSKRGNKFYAYIVECSDGTYYTGYTNDLEKRLKCHNEGVASKYTRSKLPVKLVWIKAFKEPSVALKTEVAIKQLTRLQKNALVKGRRLEKILRH